MEYLVDQVQGEVERDLPVLILGRHVDAVDDLAAQVDGRCREEPIAEVNADQQACRLGDLDEYWGLAAGRRSAAHFAAKTGLEQAVHDVRDGGPGETRKAGDIGAADSAGVVDRCENEALVVFARLSHRGLDRAVHSFASGGVRSRDRFSAWARRLGLGRDREVELCPTCEQRQNKGFVNRVCKVLLPARSTASVVWANRAGIGSSCREAGRVTQATAEWRRGGDPAQSRQAASGAAPHAQVVGISDMHAPVRRHSALIVPESDCNSDRWTRVEGAGASCGSVMYSYPGNFDCHGGVVPARRRLSPPDGQVASSARLGGGRGSGSPGGRSRNALTCACN